MPHSFNSSNISPGDQGMIAIGVEMQRRALTGCGKTLVISAIDLIS